MTNTYNKACTEVLQIINYLSDEEYNKIPKDIIIYLEENKDFAHSFEIDTDVGLLENSIMEEAYAILVALYKNYFINDRQKTVLNELLINNQKKKEEEKAKHYHNEDLFKNNKIKTEQTEVTENVALVKYNENVFVRFWNRIKSIFKKNQGY